LQLKIRAAQIQRESKFAALTGEVFVELAKIRCERMLRATELPGPTSFGAPQIRAAPSLLSMPQEIVGQLATLFGRKTKFP